MTDDKAKETMKKIRLEFYQALQKLGVPEVVAKAFATVVDEKPRMLMVKSRDGSGVERKIVVGFDPAAHPEDWVFAWWNKFKDGEGMLKDLGCSLRKTQDDEKYYKPNTWRGSWWMDPNALPDEIVEDLTEGGGRKEVDNLPDAGDWEAKAAEAETIKADEDGDLPW